MTGELEFYEDRGNEIICVKWLSKCRFFQNRILSMSNLSKSAGQLVYVRKNAPLKDDTHLVYTHKSILPIDAVPTFESLTVKDIYTLNLVSRAALSSDINAVHR